MMKEKVILCIIFALVLCLANCRGKSTVDTIVQGIPTLDIAAAFDNSRPLAFDSIVEEFEFIPLENSIKALIANPNKMEESKNRFYIVDDIRKPIKIFDKTGRFFSTLGSVGRGPNEYLDVSDIAVDWERDNVYALSDGGMIRTSIIGYDSSGRMFARNDSVIKPRISFHSDRLVLLRDYFSRSTSKGDTVTLVETFSPDLHRMGSIEGPYRGSNQITMGDPPRRWFSRHYPTVFSNNGHSILIKDVRSDTVFCVSNDSTLEPAYIFDMGDYSIPDRLFDDVQPGEGMEDLRELADKLTVVMRIFEGDRYLIVGTTKQTLIFDRHNLADGFTGTGVGEENRFFHMNGIPFTPHYIRDNRLVGYMQAIDIVDNADAITNPDLASLAATLQEDSNTVIVIAKLRK